MAALQAAQYSRVTLLTHRPPAESNSAQAQGGVAAALDSSDSPLLHTEDTLIAGAGLSDTAAAELLAWQAPALMHELAALGVPFERTNGTFALGLEGSHSHRRILHSSDATGWAITTTLARHVEACSRISLLNGYHVVDLVGNDGCCQGAIALDATGRLHRFTASATILATGGAGALYGLTSNQPDALGEGIALAYRAGAEVCDMEFVQFHPTVLRTSSGRGFLISEATRGEGATLRTADGYRFMPACDPRAELAPRDVVTRGIYDAMRRTGSDHVLLDMTHLSSSYLSHRFPTIYQRCRAEGIDPAREPVPVAPAAHYLMGGIRTNLQGATSVQGLYAAGECACTGVHGANRLASNSLLECLVMGKQVALAAVEEHLSHDVSQDASLEQEQVLILPPALLCPLPHLSSSVSANAQPGDWRARLATLMHAAAGPLRSAERMLDALHQLADNPGQLASIHSDAIMAMNATLVARLILTGALMREESRGSHFRHDIPHTKEAWQTHLVFRRGHIPYAVDIVADMDRDRDRDRDELHLMNTKEKVWIYHDKSSRISSIMHCARI
jgi:L-aspartate oxidase